MYSSGSWTLERFLFMSCSTTKDSCLNSLDSFSISGHSSSMEMAASWDGVKTVGLQARLETRDILSTLIWSGSLLDNQLAIQKVSHLEMSKIPGTNHWASQAPWNNSLKTWKREEKVLERNWRKATGPSWTISTKESPTSTGTSSQISARSLISELCYCVLRPNSSLYKLQIEPFS